MSDLKNAKIQSAISTFHTLWQTLVQETQLNYIPNSIQIDPSLFPLTHKVAGSERSFMLYLQETQSHLKQLEFYLTQDHQEKHSAQILYLIEQIKNQFTLLVRMKQMIIANQLKKPAKKTFSTNESLYQRQARYRGYLTQLKQKREDLNLQAPTALIQTQIEQLDQRIQKGKTIIADLEVQIERQEKIRQEKQDKEKLRE